MKAFIIFLATFIISMTLIIYQADLNKYISLQMILKASAEEAACGASLYYDEEAYSNGSMQINVHEGEKYLEEQVNQALSKLKLKGNYNLSASLDVKEKEVVVVLELNCKDIFRLPFLKKEKVIRGAKYELAPY